MRSRLDDFGLVLEHALRSVKPGREDDFVAAFVQAKTIIADTPGFVRLTLSKRLQRNSTYLLQVQWSRLEDHTVGFRGSGQFSSGARCCTTFTSGSPRPRSSTMSSS